MKKVKLFLGLLWLASCQRDSDIPTPAADCLVTATAHNGEIIEGDYIVTLKDSNSGPSTTVSTSTTRIAALSEQLLDKHHVSSKFIKTTFSGHKNGFLATLTKAEATALQNESAIELVEPDRIVSVCSCVDVVTPTSVTWSVRKTGYGNGENFQDKTVWIIDTGVDLDHPNLNVDKEHSRSFISGQTSADDNNGHGTHVAGIIGAINNTVGVVGVASGVKLVALKVLDQLGAGTLSSVVSAVAYVSQNGKAGDVVNMSLGLEGISATLDREVKAAAERGFCLP